MNATILEPQQQIFDNALDANERQAVEALVALHRGNAAQTQQLALDASRLVSTSQARLEKQANAGFCKRLVRAINGKAAQDRLSNQVDMLQMQKIAWHYLQQLQQQNLINAQSISIIRNNLGTMNENIIETRYFLEQAIDKINSRLCHVENNARFGTWSLNIEANMRRFKSLPSSHLVVQLTYDFLRNHSDIPLAFKDVNHLVVTLEKLGINCDEEVRLLDFISALIDQMDVSGIDRYRSNIALSTDDYLIDSTFVQANVSGIGFNALYYLSDQYAKITALTKDDELCISDDAREKIISRIFGDEFDGLETIYSLRDLISEIIGGGLVAIDLFRDMHGLNTQAAMSSEAPNEEKRSLVSDLPDIQVHSYLDVAENSDDRRDYVQLLALCLEDPADLGRQGKEFISQLAGKAGSLDVLEHFSQRAPCQQSQREQLQRLQSLLSDSDITYSWLLDGFFLLSVEQRNIENSQFMRILDTLKPTQFREHLGNILTILGESDSERLLNACASLSQLTRGWSNILRYRELRFEKVFAGNISELSAAIWAATRLSSEFIVVSRRATEYSYFIDSIDDSFLSMVGSAVGSTAFSSGRKSALISLNQLRVKVRELISSRLPTLHEANGHVYRFGMPTFNFEDETCFSDFDLDNSAGNGEWSNQFEHCQRRLENSLNDFSNACSDAQAQLQLFSKGEFTHSVVEMRARDKSDAQRREHEGNLAKRSVPVEKDGKRHLFTIEWQDLENPPCDPESIQHVKTDGKAWLLGTSEGTYYLSSDRVSWEQVYPFGKERKTSRDISSIDGVWVLIGNSGGFHYSYDGRSWEQTQYPDKGGDYSLAHTVDIVHLNDEWIWRFTRHSKYQYIEKGFLFDSKKTSFYLESLLFSTNELNGEWLPWKGAPSLAEGQEIDSLCRIPGVDSLLAFCSYDWRFTRHKKKIDAEPLVKYFVPRKSWRNCTWSGKHCHGNGSLVARIGQRLICLGSSQLFTSEKGYEWSDENACITAKECFHLGGLSILPSWSDGQVLYLSQNGSEFQEMTLEKGTWNHFCANDQGALSVYSPTRHETSLCIGNFVFHPES